MLFDYVLLKSWPKLAWVARLARHQEKITVFHGAQIEVAREWFCEAIWSGTYSKAAFDETDIVVGTGGRARDSCVTFVSSSNTLDRLQLLETKSCIWLSNSLSGLLYSVNGAVSPAYPDYVDDLGSIVGGLQNYKKHFDSSAGQVRLIYYSNLKWDGYALKEVEKPYEERDFSSFESYLHFLQSTFTSLAENMADPKRKCPYGSLTTVSSGYDSPAVAALARDAGCMEAICFDEARLAIHEKGAEIAEILGLRPIVLEREKWRSVGNFPEAAFIAGDGTGMDIPFKAAESLLSGRVLFSGFHGDKLWDKSPEDLSANVVRGDRSGLSLTEFRLSAGFLHCAVPFWGARQIRDVRAISNAAEMKPWDVPGVYSRPICRRILEEKGVPRELFGMRKAAVAYMLGSSPKFLTPTSQADYRNWLKLNRREWLKAGKRPPMFIPWADRAIWRGAQLASLSTRALLRRAAGKPLVWRLTHQRSLKRLTTIPHWGKGIGPRRFLFAWALEKTKQAFENETFLVD